jgi:hypothetical protein
MRVGCALGVSETSSPGLDEGDPEMTKSTISTAAEFAAMLAEVKVAERVCSNSRGRRRRPQASV